MADPLILRFADDVPQPAPLLTLFDGTGLYRTRALAELQLEQSDGSVLGRIRLEGCHFRLGAGGDGLLAELLGGGGATEPFDLELRWHSRDGVSIAGGAGLELTLPLRTSLPGVSIGAVHVALLPRSGAEVGAALELSASLSASWAGVIDLTVARVGVFADLIVSGGARGDAVALGPVRALVRFKPPTSVGLGLNLAGVIEGGGFVSIDPAGQQYSGLLTLTLFGIGITAIGLVTAKPAFSLLAVVTANFRPVGLDVGFGFTINAIGGLVGLHRGADLRALSEGVRNNAIGRVMFPANPVADAPLIINDMNRLFPPVDNQFLVGPLLEMGWGKPAGMITLSLGVVVGVPEPQFAILGVLRVLVPPGTDFAPVRLQVNFVGWVDFPRRILGFDASLFDSRLVLFTLDGDATARLRWGADAAFVVSVGGFHPRFTPAADLEITPTGRVSINLLPTANNPRLRLDSYYAATSNTLQHGAAIDAYAAVAGFGIKGHLAYDVLVQLVPRLRFDASISAEVAALAFGEEIFSTRLDLQISGPKPWHVRGEASFRPLPLVPPVRIPIDETFGSADVPLVSAVVLRDAFRTQAVDPRNWTAMQPTHDRILVALRAGATADGVLAHPSATIEFNQRAVPLAVNVQRFGAAPLVAPSHLTITELRAGPEHSAPLQPAVPSPSSEFAPGQYFDLTADQLLVEQAFRSFTSGVRADPGLLVRSGPAVQRPYGYQSDIRDQAAVDVPAAQPDWIIRFDMPLEYAIESLAASAVGRSTLYRDRVHARPSPTAIQLATPRYAVVDAATMTPAASVALQDSYVAAVQASAAAVSNDPRLTDRLAVVSLHELVQP